MGFWRETRNIDSAGLWRETRDTDARRLKYRFRCAAILIFGMHSCSQSLTTQLGTNLLVHTVTSILRKEVDSSSNISSMVSVGTGVERIVLIEILGEAREGRYGRRTRDFLRKSASRYHSLRPAKGSHKKVFLFLLHVNPCHEASRKNTTKDSKSK